MEHIENARTIADKLEDIKLGTNRALISLLLEHNITELKFDRDYLCDDDFNYQRIYTTIDKRIDSDAEKPYSEEIESISIEDTEMVYNSESFHLDWNDIDTDTLQFIYYIASRILEDGYAAFDMYGKQISDTDKAHWYGDIDELSEEDKEIRKNTIYAVDRIVNSEMVTCLELGDNGEIIGDLECPPNELAIIP